MNLLATVLPGVVVIEPRVFEDDRGFFLETFQRQQYEAAGLPADWIQWNHSRSLRNVLRGLHYQIEHPQGKLVSVVRGEIFDVAVDLRQDSPTFGQWASAVLSDTNHRQLYLPPGLAHGFCVLSPIADVVYACTDCYQPEHERTIRWNDADLAISWPVDEPLVSSKDRCGARFADAPYFAKQFLLVR